MCVDPAVRRLRAMIAEIHDNSMAGRQGSAVIPTVMRWWCRIIVWRSVRVRVEGMQHLPRTGPVLIASRHYHHFYDGCLLLAIIPRPVHILVALDWVWNAPLRRLMELACSM